MNQVDRFEKQLDDYTEPTFFVPQNVPQTDDMNFIYEQMSTEFKRLEKLTRQINTWRTGESQGLRSQTLSGEYFSSSEEYSYSSSELPTQYYTDARLSFHEENVMEGYDKQHITFALTDRKKHIRGPPQRFVGLTASQPYKASSREKIYSSESENERNLPSRLTPFKINQLKIHSVTDSDTRRSESEDLQQKPDTSVISSMTVKRNMSVEKQLKQPLKKAPEASFRSRQRLQLKPTTHQREADVKLVYLQLTTAKTEHETSTRGDGNSVDEGVQVEINIVPIEDGEIINVEKRVITLGKDETGSLKPKEDKPYIETQTMDHKEIAKDEKPHKEDKETTTKSHKSNDIGIQMTTETRAETILRYLNLPDHPGETAKLADAQKQPQTKCASTETDFPQPTPTTKIVPQSPVQLVKDATPMPEPITFSVCASQTPMQTYGEGISAATLEVPKKQTDSVVHQTTMPSLTEDDATHLVTDNQPTLTHSVQTVKPTFVATATMTSRDYESAPAPIVVEKAAPVEHSAPPMDQKPASTDAQAVTVPLETSAREAQPSPGELKYITSSDTLTKSTPLNLTSTEVLAEGRRTTHQQATTQLTDTDKASALLSGVAPHPQHIVTVSAQTVKPTFLATATMTSSDNESAPAPIVVEKAAPVEHTAPPMPEQPETTDAQSS
ncbi:unnamed protein product, partial [Dibothriocephalus latus]